MNDYVIMADSTCDFTGEIVQQMEIYTIPFPFTINDITYKNYPDQREMKIADFYQKMKNGALPVTSQVNPTAYEEYFGEILKKNKDIVYFCFSSGLSGSYQSAVMAARNVMEEFPGKNVEVIDTTAASVGEAAIVYEASKKQKEGCSCEELIKWAKENCKNARHWFMVEDLYHLKRGGRVTAVEALVGTALKIKPILSIDEEGKLNVISKVRGIKNALDYIVKNVEADTKDQKGNAVYFIGHADCQARAEKIVEMLKSDGFGMEYHIFEIGPVIGTHVGPGMCACAYLKK